MRGIVKATALLAGEAARAYIPPPGEAALAVAATQCARATGYAGTYVAERLAVVRHVIGAHAERLADLGRRIDQMAANA